MQPQADPVRDAERRRLETLKSYRLDGPAPDAAFDHIVRLAADLFEAPTALVSFVGEDEQVFGGRTGFDRCGTGCDVSFCAHAIAGDAVMVVTDTLDDPRFRDNPLVTGEPFIRFYAGAPIVTSEGYRLGSVCVIDTAPRPPLTERQCGLLQSLAKIVMSHLESRRLDAMRDTATWMSERDHAQERIRHLTHFDRLTDLPNRAQFLERIDHALSDVGRFAVLKVGLDRFKAVNGTMGMAAGDGVLVEAAKRVRDAAGPSAIIARLGGDEFGVLLTGAEAVAMACGLATRLVQRLGEPFPVGATLCHLSASVGVVMGPDPSIAMEADCVLKCGLLALQHAKRTGGHRVEVFQPQLSAWADERRRTEEEFPGALARGEFELHFQPQVRLPDGHLVGAEALLRWRHPERGLLSPAAFLPSLEASAMAVPVGRWIIREACAFAAGMAAAGLPLRVGVNLFAAQLRDPGLFDDVASALAATRLPGCLFELEITETTVLGLDESTIAPLRRLRGLGVGIAFDDYGTGYASLSLLKRYPLTRLKIDREFVRDLRTDLNDAAIVKAVIALGISLGLDVIAEGIETAEQASALVGFGCREAQGYLFGRPMAADDFVRRTAVAPILEVA